jgi:hypothetical protein
VQKKLSVQEKKVNLKESMDLKKINQSLIEDREDKKTKKMKKFITDIIGWIKGVFNDEKGNPSSKRIVGMGCAVALCLTMYHNSFSDVSVAPAEYLVDSVALLAFGCLGLASFDKFTARRSNKKEEESE